MNDKSAYTNRRKRFTRQSIITNTFYQMPRFLTAGEFAGNKLSNNARILYTLLHDRHRISVKNGWFDENGEVYIYFKREEMETQLGLSERTVVKVMQELKDVLLVEEKKQGMNKPNKIYLLTPVIADNENAEPYLDPEADYNPEDGHSGEWTDVYNEGYSRPATPTPTEPQKISPQHRKNYDAEPVNSTPPNPQELRPNDNKLINNKKNDNKLSDNEGSETTTAAYCGTGGGEPPYTEIIALFNQLCEARGLRPIRSINGKRKSRATAIFKAHGISGFTDLFDSVAASVFLCGGGERGWKADFDWLIDPSNMQKVLEGKYDNEQTPIPVSEQGFIYFPSQSGVIEMPYNPTPQGHIGEVVHPVHTTPYPNYRNKNGFNTMAALQQMLDAEQVHEGQYDKKGAAI